MLNPERPKESVYRSITWTWWTFYTTLDAMACKADLGVEAWDQVLDGPDMALQVRFHTRSYAHSYLDVVACLKMLKTEYALDRIASRHRELVFNVRVQVYASEP